jgi:hypothetical protein
MQITNQAASMFVGVAQSVIKTNYQFDFFIITPLPQQKDWAWLVHQIFISSKQKRCRKMLSQPVQMQK